ncbi:MAG: hypothetical protein A2283_10845 [Lentisphaerae bacterium RIFOXYA12_FULL_48_11]|nr:MAG: hypothetical protein A2283_10845 [Lentisphaerae bacterium RIFOXYA12_FULL_48_11]
MSEKKRVLIVDDDEVVRLLIGKVLDKYGVITVTARDGIEARTILGNNEAFNVIFLDLFIPHVTGWDLLDEIRSGNVNKDAAVVIVTGAALSDPEKESLGNRVSAFVDKEKFNLVEFDKLVASLL